MFHASAIQVSFCFAWERTNHADKFPVLQVKLYLLLIGFSFVINCLVLEKILSRLKIKIILAMDDPTYCAQHGCPTSILNTNLVFTLRQRAFDKSYSNYTETPTQIV